MTSISKKQTSAFASMSAAKKAAKTAAEKTDEAAAREIATQASSAKNEDSFTNSKTGELSLASGTSKLNKDGSLTTAVEKKTEGAQLYQQLTTFENRVTKKSRRRLEEYRTTKDLATSTRITEETDHLGRLTSTESKEARLQKGDVIDSKSLETAVDAYGNKKVTTGQSKGVRNGDTLSTDSSSTTQGAFGSRSKSTEKQSETFTGGDVLDMVMDNGKKGDRLTTTTSKSTTGSDFALNSSMEFNDGTFTLKDSADWKKNSFNKEFVKEKQLQLKDAKGPDTGFTQVNLSSKLNKAQVVADMLDAAGLQKTVLDGKKFDTTNKPESFATTNSEFVGSRVGVRGEGHLTVGVSGVEGKFKREAVAGQYAEKSHEVARKHGKAGYQAQAKVEAKATFDASGRLNLNGLEMTMGSKAGVVAESSLKGTLRTKPAKLGNVELTAGVEASVRAAAEASAEATGAVKITRNPPTAIAYGKLGASAVAKAEADVKAFAGPFAVRASGYASAGAEATASGVIGYQDGKLKLGGSLGAALGVGLGGSVAVEVDVEQIGQVAKNAADVNGDGKLGVDDVGAVARSAKSAVSRAASRARSWMPW